MGADEVYLTQFSSLQKSIPTQIRQLILIVMDICGGVDFLKLINNVLFERARAAGVVPRDALCQTSHRGRGRGLSHIKCFNARVDSHTNSSTCSLCEW